MIKCRIINANADIAVSTCSQLSCRHRYTIHTFCSCMNCMNLCASNKAIVVELFIFFFLLYYSSTSSFSFVFSRYFFYGSFLWLLWTQRPLTNVYVQRGLFMIAFLCGAKINSTSKCTSTTMTRERVTHSVMRFTNKRVNTYICIRTIKCMQKFTFSVFFLLILYVGHISLFWIYNSKL